MLATSGCQEGRAGSSRELIKGRSSMGSNVKPSTAASQQMLLSRHLQEIHRDSGSLARDQEEHTCIPE